MAGTTVVLSWARTNKQVCYEAECQTKTGERAGWPLVICREWADDAELCVVVIPRRGSLQWRADTHRIVCNSAVARE